MDIGRAVQLMKIGGVLITRLNRRYYLQYVPAYTYGNGELGLPDNIIHTERILKIHDRVATVWIPSQADLLAEDYIVVEKEK